MTYCVGLLLDAGIVLLSDTRTNAGVDNVAIYRKMFTFEEPGERVMAVMTAGSLSVTQTTLARLQESLSDGEGDETATPNLTPNFMRAPTMLEAAMIVGNTLRDVAHDIQSRMGQGAAVDASASLILAGQRKGGEMRLFLIYPEGNFIEATADTPFLQIGEHKYGKPILDRVVRPETSIDDAQKAVLLSMDSTLRSNLSVGMPLDLVVIERDALRVASERRIDAGDEAFLAMSSAWSEALRNAFQEIAIR
ncbi:MAG: proteasome-type protease [Pseudomonadota bacterium]